MAGFSRLIKYIGNHLEVNESWGKFWPLSVEKRASEKKKWLCLRPQTASTAKVNNLRVNGTFERFRKFGCFREPYGRGSRRIRSRLRVFEQNKNTANAASASDVGALIFKLMLFSLQSVLFPLTRD